MIEKYGKLEKSIRAKEDCAIGVGYTTCVDTGFKAVELFKIID